MSAKLQVLVSTIGAAGIARLAAQTWPGDAGVERIIVWQHPEGQVPQSLQRPDTRIILCPSRGLSASRNRALAEASAPWALLSDDDVSFMPGQLSTLAAVLERTPDADIAAIRADIEGSTKVYPTERMSLSVLPAGYWLSSIELAIRPQRWREAGMTFRTEFGLGSGVFESGEEDVMRTDALKRGMRMVFIPVEAGRHAGPSTGMRRERPPYWFAKGGVARYMRGRWWWLALRSVPLSKWRHFVRGVRRGSRISRSDEF